MHMHMHLLGILDTILATKGGDGVGTEPRYEQCLSMEDHSNKYCFVMYDYTICTKEAFDICTRTVVYESCNHKLYPSCTTSNNLYQYFIKSELNNLQIVIQNLN